MRLILIFFLFFPTVSCLTAQNTAGVYIEKFDSLALEILNKYEIPASVVLGIAMHESGAGTSKLCRINHNHFGVRGHVKSSKTKSGHTAAYRHFISDEAAYLHFGEMISRKRFYPELKGNTDYMKWLKALKAANYAATPTWVSAVDKMIRRYDLTRFDRRETVQVTTSTAVADTIQ